ncbi:Uncharacterised protein [Zhongshania aliphaticivorans]|uniref:3-hydroxylacyl-ACP dehydratase n=1 Tax=Zhongshania aliphaticivorans TaxID=1470434 RepID=A0A5S9PRG2_9GAMM|nr:hydroxymyristoyl-ACP dehydratase [Zhongshania aliphaticivorans]CAA0106534.1 Uncharacterised protein [Zhongshania aliphaticivorans]CAA0106695.1 Uncharacterised protein [Zhongshania aliphaticivorans]
MAEQEVIDGERLASLLPHSGAMCLLDKVLSWDERIIHCRAESHRNANNPLRDRGILPIHAGIEYAAQAMAIHGRLCQGQEGGLKIGYLVVLTGVDWYCPRLDDLPEALMIAAERVVAANNGFNYRFSLTHQSKVLLEGQAVVALEEN